MKFASKRVISNQPEAKRKKIQEASENLIELEIVSSDEDVKKIAKATIPNTSYFEYGLSSR